MDSPYYMHDGSILLSEYETKIAATDVIGSSSLNPILQGLYGEVGAIMSTAKKLIREGHAFPDHSHAAEEEFGDTLWYLAALCRRLNISLDELFVEATSNGQFKKIGVATDLQKGGFAHVAVPDGNVSVDSTLFSLGRSAAALLTEVPSRQDMVVFAREFLTALHATNLRFADVARRNMLKARGAFLEPDASELEDFDARFPSEEQLPRRFEIRVNQRGSGKSYLQWNGVFIGDPLTDNISDPDGYRFHDVFHFAFAAILHWSPVMRSLIKQKRKSSPAHDEGQDSGRAAVVEEGVSAWIFARAKELNFFEGQDRIAFGMLKTIGQFVSGYEVERCPLKLWERAILEGYAVFRQVKQANGGWIVGDRESRTVRYRSLESPK